MWSPCNCVDSAQANATGKIPFRVIPTYLPWLSTVSLIAVPSIYERRYNFRSFTVVWYSIPFRRNHIASNAYSMGYSELLQCSEWFPFSLFIWPYLALHILNYGSQHQQSGACFPLKTSNDVLYALAPQREPLFKEPFVKMFHSILLLWFWYWFYS